MPCSIGLPLRDKARDAKMTKRGRGGESIEAREGGAPSRLGPVCHSAAQLSKECPPSLSHSFCPPPPSPPSEGIYGVAEWMGVMPSPFSLSRSLPLNLLSLFLVSRQFPRSSAIKSDEDTMTLNVPSTGNMIQGNRNFHVPHEVLSPLLLF